MMKNNTRRHFLQKGILLSLGTAAVSGVAIGQTEAEAALKSVDPELAKVLHSYGRAEVLERGGFENLKQGSRTRRLPVSRLGVRVRNQEAFRASFEQLTELSERVMVEGNTVRFARAGRFYVVENRVA